MSLLGPELLLGFMSDLPKMVDITELPVYAVAPAVFDIYSTTKSTGFNIDLFRQITPRHNP